MNPSLYFKQIEIGPMHNYVYLVGSTETREAAVVDAAWDIDEILRIAAQDEMEITHDLVTHTHPDHVGGGFAGIEIAGATELLDKCKAKVVVHKAEAEFIKGLSSSDMIKTDNGDKVDVGGLEITLMHTPGHTPGSQCFLVDDRVVSGDTLFIDACGRVDFPGGNPEKMYYSLTQKLMTLPDNMILFPGHNYAPLKHATLGEQKRTNPYLKFSSLKQFLAAMGYS
ncbi:MAG TPA: MBL fold metallo-hydrolase [Candidatus Binatia bacterium]|nr:MBL fold metallo-hydrolase [Candidatus Binatia bacterium]HET9885317.1 MBL fold metallo-hydrolase [Candidatus Binatia bacterium]